MADQMNEKPKGKIPAVFGSVGRLLKNGLRSAGMILAVVALLMILCINIWIAYIMFAPDTMPKPFYLAYQGQGGEAPAEKASAPQSAAAADQAAAAAIAAAQRVEPKAPSVPLEIKAGQGIMFDTGSKIVNLADPSGRRYVKTNIILEYAPNDITYFLEMKAPAAGVTPAGGEGAKGVTTVSYSDKFKEELEPMRPLIDDTIITLLSSKTFEQVYTAAGKEQLRKEMVNLLNSRMPENRVIFVYFTEFTVQ